MLIKIELKFHERGETILISIRFLQKRKRLPKVYLEVLGSNPTPAKNRLKFKFETSLALL